MNVLSYTTEARRHGGCSFLNSLCLRVSVVRMSVLCCVVLLSACSKRERSDPDADEWADIQAMADDAIAEPAAAGTNTVAEPPGTATVEPAGDFSAFINRLEQMKSAGREAGETLLTGESLVLDYDRRFVRMDTNVVVEDDQGTLKTESLIGRFSVSNQVEYIEAKGGVDIVSGERKASAQEAVYNYQNGFVRLLGQATASDGGNRLSGEQIELWIKGSRKMVCEPNALLEIAGTGGLKLDGVPEGASGDAEVRADRVEYDESEGLAVLTGNVRVRDPRAAMNCNLVHLYLKDNNEIDWIEATGEVIIQIDNRRALADRAVYLASEGKVTLEGEPIMKQGQSYLTGDKIDIWVDPIRMVCEPNARAKLYITDEMRAKFLKDLNE